MAAFTTIAAVVGAVGVAAAGVGAVVQAGAAKDAAKASQKAEELRKAQVALEADRQRRAILRQAAVARGLALSNAASQGAMGGSGIQGGLAQIATGAAENVSAVTQSQGISNQIFDQNKQIASAQGRGAVGGAISSVGGALIQNQEAFGRVGSYLMSPRGTA